VVATSGKEVVKVYAPGLRIKQEIDSLHDTDLYLSNSKFTFYNEGLDDLDLVGTVTTNATGTSGRLVYSTPSLTRLGQLLNTHVEHAVENALGGDRGSGMKITRYSSRYRYRRGLILGRESFLMTGGVVTNNGLEAATAKVSVKWTSLDS
jgi:hypothetical protein